MIDRHYHAAWGRDGEVCPFAAGPVEELPVDFRILRFDPNEVRSVWTYATVGMSQPGDDHGLELHLFSDRPSPEIVELLYATAHFHRTGARLGLGHTVNFGQPWLKESHCTHGLVSLPYLDGPALEHALIFSQAVQCLWLIPITAEELNFKKLLGLDALEERFEAQAFAYASPLRASVC